MACVPLKVKPVLQVTQPGVPCWTVAPCWHWLSSAPFAGALTPDTVHEAAQAATTGVKPSGREGGRGAVVFVGGGEGEGRRVIDCVVVSGGGEWWW